MRASSLLSLPLFAALVSGPLHAKHEPPAALEAGFEPALSAEPAEDAPAPSDRVEEAPAAAPFESPPDPASAPFEEEDAVAPLVERAMADEAWARCFADASPVGRAALRACLADVSTRFSGTPGGLRAEGGLRALSFDEVPDLPTGLQIPPGRLELSSTAGLFGIWSGIAGGIAVVSHLRGDNPAPAILGTGMLALGLGIGAGIGGYYLADAFDMGEGDSRLVSSGLVWGTTFGLALLPALFELGLPEGFAVSVPLTAIVAAGLAGGAAAFGVTRFARLSSAEVSLVNTGGWLGALFGLLALPNLAAFSVDSPLAYSATYTGVAALGLGLGALASQLLELSWGETLLLDLGAVLGLVGGATLVFSLSAAGAYSTLPGLVSVPLNTGTVGLSALAGLAVTGLGIGLLRGGERPIFRMVGLEIEPALGVPTVALDMARQPVLIVPGPALRFSL
jgi:hypothetical protein